MAEERKQIFISEKEIDIMIKALMEIPLKSQEELDLLKRLNCFKVKVFGKE